MGDKVGQHESDEKKPGEPGGRWIGFVTKFEKTLPGPLDSLPWILMNREVAGVTRTVPEHSVIRDAVMLACRAPSVHNSQPWLWVAEGTALHLFANPKRLLRITDRTGREMLLSCGAVLDHLNIAMAALGWRTAVDRFPEAGGHDHLATLHFSRRPASTIPRPGVRMRS